MKISLNWLRDWVDTGTDVPALAHALTMAGLAACIVPARRATKADPIAALTEG